MPKDLIPAKWPHGLYKRERESRSPPWGLWGVLRGFLFYSSEEEKLSGKRCQPEGKEGEKPSLSFSAPARNYQERGRKEPASLFFLSPLREEGKDYSNAWHSFTTEYLKMGRSDLRAKKFSSSHLDSASISIDFYASVEQCSKIHPTSLFLGTGDEETKEIFLWTR